MIIHTTDIRILPVRIQDVLPIYAIRQELGKIIIVMLGVVHLMLQVVQNLVMQTIIALVEVAVLGRVELQDAHPITVMEVLSMFIQQVVTDIVMAAGIANLVLALKHQLDVHKQGIGMAMG